MPCSKKEDGAMNNPLIHFHKRSRIGRDEKIINAIGCFLIGLFALFCLMPFYLILIASFTPNSELIRSGFPLVLKQASLEAYKLCLKKPDVIIQAYKNTIGITLIGTFLSVFLSTMTGFVLSRKDFPWRNYFAFFFFFTTLFSGGLVPWYILCTRYLGFKNHYYALVVPLMFSVWNMIISKSFMSSIPQEIVESAKIDGANDFIIYVRLILPICKPLLATLGLFSALGYWNDWYNCMLFITDNSKHNLQYYLQNMLGSAQNMRIVAEKSGLPLTNVPLESMKMAMTIIATGPIILLYPFIQRYFVKGLTIGAIKG